MKRNCVSVLLFAFVVSVGCSSGWTVIKNPRSSEALVGNGYGESRMLQTAVSEATLNARGNIAAQIEVRLKGYQSRCVKEIGEGREAQIVRVFEDALKQIISAELHGSAVVEESWREKNDLYQAKVLVEYPTGAANLAVQSQMETEEALYSEWVKTRVFADMEKEVQEYEQWKSKR